MHTIETKPRFDVSLLDEPKEKTSYDKGYAVILWDDDVNDMEYVVMCICKIMKFSFTKAEEHMVEAHKKGKTVLILTNLERGELYSQQLGSAGLSVTLEKQ